MQSHARSGGGALAVGHFSEHSGAGTPPGSGGPGVDPDRAGMGRERMPLPANGRKAAALPAVVALVVSGCGSEEQPPFDPVADVPLAEELKYLPMPEEREHIVLYASDYARAGELIDEPKPGPGAGEHDYVDWLMLASLTAGQEPHVAVILPQVYGWADRLGALDTMEEELGVSYAHAEQVIEMRADSEDAMVVHGPYEMQQIDEALGPAEDGVFTFGEPGGASLEDVHIHPPAGRSVSMAEHDNRLLVSHFPDLVSGVSRGEVQVLAEDEHALAVAQALDTGTWYGAMLMSHPDAPGQAGYVEAVQPGIPGTEVDSPLEAYEWAGIAVDYDPAEGEHVVRVAYSHSSSEQARANAEAVEQILDEGTASGGSSEDRGPAYSEFLELAELEVADGVLLVTLHQSEETVGEMWSRFGAGTEPLFVYPVEDSR